MTDTLARFLNYRAALRRETLPNLDEAMAAWIESCLIAGDPIPEPGRALTLAV
ncbi:MAG: hypothetical protein ACKVT1_03255 [Dehalococcoidia bacterium]